MAQSKFSEFSNQKWWIFPVRYVNVYQRVSFWGIKPMFGTGTLQKLLDVHLELGWRPLAHVHAGNFRPCAVWGTRFGTKPYVPIKMEHDKNHTSCFWLLSDTTDRHDFAPPIFCGVFCSNWQKLVSMIFHTCLELLCFCFQVSCYLEPSWFLKGSGSPTVCPYSCGSIPADPVYNGVNILISITCSIIIWYRNTVIYGNMKFSMLQEVHADNNPI